MKLKEDKFGQQFWTQDSAQTTNNTTFSGQLVASFSNRLKKKFPMGYRNKLLRWKLSVHHVARKRFLIDNVTLKIVLCGITLMKPFHSLPIIITFLWSRRLGQAKLYRIFLVDMHMLVSDLDAPHGLNLAPCCTKWRHDANSQNPLC